MKNLEAEAKELSAVLAEQSAWRVTNASVSSEDDDVRNSGDDDGGYGCQTCAKSPSRECDHRPRRPTGRWAGNHLIAHGIASNHQFDQAPILGYAKELPGRKSVILGAYAAPHTAKPIGKGGGLRPQPFPIGFAVRGGRLHRKKYRISGPEALLRNLK